MQVAIKSRKSILTRQSRTCSRAFLVTQYIKLKEFNNDKQNPVLKGIVGVSVTGGLRL